MPAFAQKQTVKGKVISEDGQEVIGATVMVKGAKGVGAVTDLNGNFSITVNNAASDELIVSYIGMASKNVKVKGRSRVDVTLQENAQSLDDVVVIGYGTMRRKDLTGSVASIKGDELLKVPGNDVSKALAGRIAGLQVNQSDGAPCRDRVHRRA